MVQKASHSDTSPPKSPSPWGGLARDVWKIIAGESEEAVLACKPGGKGNCSLFNNVVTTGP